MSVVVQTGTFQPALIERPARKLVILRSIEATDYYAFCEEIGCDVFEKTWGELQQLEGAMGDPMGLWLPEMLVRHGTSIYAIGIEVTADYVGPLPDGTEVIDLLPTTYLLFHAPPSQTMFDAVRTQIGQYDPASHGLSWAKDSAPVFQFAPDDVHGYTEGHPVKR